MQRSSKATDHSVCCPLVVVPTRNDWKPGGNRVRKEGTASHSRGEKGKCLHLTGLAHQGSLRGRGSSPLNQPVIRATKKRTDKIRRI